MNIHNHPWTSVTKISSFRFKTLVPGSHTDLRESVACHSACTGRTEWGPIYQSSKLLLYIYNTTDIYRYIIDIYRSSIFSTRFVRFFFGANAYGATFDVACEDLVAALGPLSLKASEPLEAQSVGRIARQWDEYSWDIVLLYHIILWILWIYHIYGILYYGILYHIIINKYIYIISTGIDNNNMPYFSTGIL